jgi:hypothetical protein
MPSDFVKFASRKQLPAVASGHGLTTTPFAAPRRGEIIQENKERRGLLYAFPWHIMLS